MDEKSSLERHYACLVEKRNGWGIVFSPSSSPSPTSSLERRRLILRGSSLVCHCAERLGNNIELGLDHIVLCNVNFVINQGQPISNSTPEMCYYFCASHPPLWEQDNSLLCHHGDNCMFLKLSDNIIMKAIIIEEINSSSFWSDFKYWVTNGEWRKTGERELYKYQNRGQFHTLEQERKITIHSYCKTHITSLLSTK